MKVVIDTNVLLRSIPRHAPEHLIYDAFVSNKFNWVFSNEILFEYAEIIALFYNEKLMDMVLSILLQAENVERFEPSYKWQLVINDPDDNKFVDCAIGANVDYLVTDDRDIRLLLKNPNLFPPIPIVSFRQFKKILEG